MKLGIAANFVWSGPPATELAKFIESAGFDSMWVGEHPVIPVSAANAVRYGVPLPPNYRHMPDQLTTISAAAAVTSTLKFGTNVCIVPQHEVINLAKAVATVDQISKGRLIFGFGTGWIEDEAPVFGYPFDKRLGVTLDYMKAMKLLWTEEEAGYSGDYVSFPPLHCNPKPYQKPHVPILVGSGNDKTQNTAILKRVARMADGWLPSFLSPQQAREQLDELRGYCEEEGRDFSKLDITLLIPAISFGVGELPPWGANAYDDLEPVDAQQLLGEYEETGVGRIIVGLPDMEDDASFGRIEEAAKGLGVA